MSAIYGSRPEPIIVPVELGERAYRIVIGDGLLTRAGALLKEISRGRIIIVTDENVAARHLPALQMALTSAALGFSAPIIVPPGEQTKSFNELERLMHALLSRGLERGDLVLAFGGGVIGDLAGFAASIALRGVDFVQIPTTLLAQVDSSAGGKTAIDTEYGKNTIGAFYQPRLVIIDTALLKTLPNRELKAGYAELMKHGLLADGEFFAWLNANASCIFSFDAVLTPQAVARSLAIKARIVADDEREHGARALLNLGHTFAHALEVELGYSTQLLHGEAVAIGCMLAARLSVRLGHCNIDVARNLENHLRATGLPAAPRDLGLAGFDAQRLIAHMRRDKKAKGGKITLVLLERIGKAFVTQTIEESTLASFLQDELT